MSVYTLQEHLERRAKERADAEAFRMVKGFNGPSAPFIGQAWDKNTLAFLGDVQLEWHRLSGNLRGAIAKELYQQYLDEETHALLDACNQVRDLINQQGGDE